MSQNYRIPNRIKNMVTKEFLQVFKLELDEIFKLGDSETAWSTYYHLTHTCGWNKSFKHACNNHEIKHFGVGILKYYNKLYWYNSDLFDTSIVNLMIKHRIINEGILDDTYSFFIEDNYIWELDRLGSGCKIYKKKIHMVGVNV